MKNKHSFKLIEGIFAPEKARGILLELINNKINFHQREIIALKEKFDDSSLYSEKRIQGLKQTSMELKEILNYAEQKNIKLIVKSNIEIVFAE